MADVSVVAAILFGLWVFVVTSRSRRTMPEPPLPKSDSAASPSFESDTWSFEPESSNQGAIERRDHWVLH